MIDDHRGSALRRRLTLHLRLTRLRLRLLRLTLLGLVLDLRPAVEYRLVLARLLLAPRPKTPGRAGRRAEDGQSTVEYALVLLGAAAVALALVAWVTRSDAIGRLFDVILGRVLSRAG